MFFSGARACNTETEIQRANRAVRVEIVAGFDWCDREAG